MLNCRHAEPTDRPTVHVCRLGLYGGRPHIGVCMSCRERSEPGRARPGQLLKSAIHKITGEQPSECSCNKRAQQMDANGWWWCWRNRRAIAGWLVESAKARPAKIRKQAQQLREQADALDAKAADAEQVAKSLDETRSVTLLRAAWRELRQAKPS